MTTKRQNRYQVTIGSDNIILLAPEYLSQDQYDFMLLWIEQLRLTEKKESKVILHPLRRLLKLVQGIPS